MAVIIHPDATWKQIHPKGKKFTLEEMYELIGCSLVEAVYLRNGDIAWIDEEGKLKEHEVNDLASNLLHYALRSGDYFAGTVLITSPGEVD